VASEENTGVITELSLYRFMKDGNTLRAKASAALVMMGMLIGGTASGAVSSLRIDGVSSFYDVPYLLDFNFSLRDQDNHAVVVDPINIVVVCKEDGAPISASETGYRLLSGANKQLKCFLVLDYTLSMADPTYNGDTNSNGYSDALEIMEAAAKTMVGTLTNDAQIGIYEFHREDVAHPPQKVIDLTVDKVALTNHIDRIWTDYVQFFPAATRCWDAVYAAVNEFPSANPGDEQRFVVFLSDGKDESSTRQPSEVINIAASKGVKIYAIGFGRELQPAALQSMASQTRGQYYTAANLTELAQRFQQISDDLRGQYVLRWATLKRSDSAFTPSFELTYQGKTANHTGSSYRPTSYTGEVLQGRLLFDPSLGEEGRATVGLRALYVPRFVTRIRLTYFATQTPQVTKVPYAEGGICPDTWVMEHDVQQGWVELRSPTPQNIFSGLPYATLGKLLKFEFQGVTNLTHCFFELGLDNSFYPGGQSFIFVNATAVSPGPGEPVMGTPIDWLNKYGFTSSYARAELSDQDGDGMATWQEYIAGTIPTNGLSVFRFEDLAVDPTERQLVMSTESNRIYRVDWSEDLKTWQALQTGIKGDGKSKVLTDSIATSQRFYRATITEFPKPPPEIAGMVWINPGTFTMGSPSTEKDRGSNEGPQTQVTLTKGYWMGKYEVTQREYQVVMGSNPSYFTGDLDRPVEQVTWNDATNYCVKLTASERSSGRLPSGYAYRLPTEAEWEYACRAGTTTATAFGNSLSSTQANFDGNYPYNGAAEGPWLRCTTKVGSYAPNAWGLYDMHGNVYEWCMDWYQDSLPEGSVTDPRGPSSGSNRVIRGGSWSHYGRYCRSALRYGNSPGGRHGSVGFRVVLAPGP